MGWEERDEYDQHTLYKFIKELIKCKKERKGVRRKKKKKKKNQRLISIMRIRCARRDAVL